jgi:hypothetical protein
MQPCRAKRRDRRRAAAAAKVTRPPPGALAVVSVRSLAIALDLRVGTGDETIEITPHLCGE